MSRPLALFLRRSRGALPSFTACRRPYSVGQIEPEATTTTGSTADPGSSTASPSTPQQPEGSIVRRVPQRKSLPPAVDLEFENGAPANIDVYARSFRIRLPRPVSKRTWDRRYDFVHLRDCCSCPRCLDQHSKQRNFRTSDIPQNIVPTSMKWDGKELVVRWKNDIPGFDESHVSTYSHDFLRAPVSYAVGSTSQTRSRYMWKGTAMKKMQHWISYDDYVNDDEKFAKAMRHLSTLGLIFIKDIPDSREMVEKIATRMGPLRNSFYGSTWDVKSIPQAKNVAYTDQFLGFHMDLMYMNDPPGFQLLHCLKNSCEGGESLFVDGFQAARVLQSRYPLYFETLQNFKLNYEYIHQDQMYHKSWPVIETHTNNKPSQKPQITRVNYSPPFQGPLRSTPGDTWGRNLRNFNKALARFAKELEAPHNVFELKLNPGECVIFENRRVLHARKSFDTTAGERWLAGAYVDEDAVLSKFRVLRRDQPDAWFGAFNEYHRAQAAEREEAAAQEGVKEGNQPETAREGVQEGTKVEEKKE